ncbi:DUF6541 family protein [Arsenicicoccus bolidensis]|uniref:Uncharacterized protein n=1 Tax=Arsenicicoccus bolidensis TaxID=229480 RepID=A0ABS9Q2G5_9MICO|nr:DUF6541 family protein [Arsenicicoccus bolidensis]MCG7322054.1 hypothetical protein [Arsenicicoccus bolidensis]
MSWISACAPLAVAIALLVLPGLLVGLAAGLDRVRLWLFAPLLSVTSLGVGVALGTVLRLGWGLGTAALGAAGVALAAGVVRLLLDRAAPLRVWGWTRRERDLRSVDGALVLATTAVSMAAIAVVAARGVGSPDALQQTYDAAFHVNAVDHVIQTGRASPSDISGVTTFKGSPAFYPPLFHAVAGLVAILTGCGAVVACNIAALALSAVAWPASLVALAVTLRHSPRLLPVGATLLAVVVQAFPYLLMYFGVLWPNALGIAVMPAVVALVVEALRATADGRGALARPMAVVLGLLSVVGLYYSHPGTVFGVVAVALPVLVAVLLPQVRRRYAASRRGRLEALAIVVAAVAVVVIATVAMSTVPQLMRIRAFDWPTAGPMQGAMGNALVMTTSPDAATVTWAVGALIVLGAVECLRRHRLRWLVAAHALLIYLYALSVGTDAPLSAMLTGFWYNDSFRIMAMLPVTGVPLAAIGLAPVQRGCGRLLAELTLDRWAGRGRELGAWALTVGLVVLALPGTLGLGVPSKVVAGGYRPTNPEEVMVTPGERQLYEQLGERHGDGRAVVGNPWTGAAYAGVLSGHPVLWPHFAIVTDDDRNLLRHHFKEYQSDRAVCAAVQRLGVGYAVDDTNHYRGSNQYWRGFPGMNDLDGVPGLQVIGRSGTATVYSVAPCQA